ncbi:DUF948 domain-containing protein [Halalkalibacter lacteus]|uniref:DUF948 domain-containing protein n=1 Tax=Halalkalibacter lacteus TaxID=3090663 RepID=UPI002FC9A087
MESLLYISALVAAVAFAVLVIYLVRTLKSANRTLEHVANTMAGLEKQVNGITKETEELLHRTNRLADDIQEKSESLNTVFSSVKELGDSIGQVNKSLRHMSNTVSTQVVKQSDQIAKAVQWGNVAIDLYSKFKQKKEKSSNEMKEEKDYE